MEVPATRLATLDDLARVADTLASSHVDYVWEQWAFAEPDDTVRRAHIERLARLDVGQVGLALGEVWIHGGGAAVAVWLPSDAPEPSPDLAHRLHAAARDAFGDRLELIADVETVARSHRPVEPHWFLATMGTRPERRRQGCGTAVLRPMLDRLDRERIPACLETSLDTNVAFYATLGFVPIVALTDLPHGAPNTWVLRRDPS